jgi:hypothetical protein
VTVETLHVVVLAKARTCNHRLALFAEYPLGVIARSISDEAIQTTAAEKFLDCFASLAMTG